MRVLGERLRSQGSPVYGTVYVAKNTRVAKMDTHWMVEGYVDQRIIATGFGRLDSRG
jgi:hypothetical protein